MQILHKLIVSLFAFMLATTVHARIWTTTDNRTFEADYVTATATHVTVKLKDGRTAPVEITRLSQADRAFIAQQRVAGPAAPSTTPAAATAPTTGSAVSPTPPNAAGLLSASKGPYAEHITGDWNQFAGKGNLQCMLFAAPTLDPSKKWPLVIYLHGKNQNVLSQEGLGFAKACAKPENYRERPCIILAPQCPDSNGWSGATVENLLKTVKDMTHHLPIDQDRIYLVGLSMGGFGTFLLLNQEPRMFAAGVPIAGSCNVDIAHNIRRIPLWIFHGEKDTTVSPEGSRAIAKALEKMKAPVTYTELPGEGHGIGEKVNSNPELHTWLFAQKRGK